MDWYTAALKKYAVFSGRARRKEYWMFFLVNIIISAVLSIIQLAVPSIAGVISVLSGLYGLAILIPSLAVGVRRLHDTNRTGWWLFIGLIPVIGTIILIVFFAQDSQAGDNQYGPNPKAAPASATAAA